MKQMPWKIFGGTVVNAAVNEVAQCHGPVRILEYEGQIKNILKTKL
jgi:hypothetical protein